MGYFLGYLWNMRIKHRINFRLFPYGKNTKKYQIRARVTFNGERVDISSGIALLSSESWDADLERVTGKNALDANSRLYKMQDMLEMSIRSFEVEDKYPSVAEFKERFDSLWKGASAAEKVEAKQKNSAPGFYDVFDMFMQECGEKNAWTIATYQKWYSLKEDVHSYKPKTKFEDLNESFLTGFVGYLRDSKALKTPRKPKGDRSEYDPEDVTGIKNSTLAKKLEYLRWFLNWATAKGFNNNLTYKFFRPTLKQTQKKVIYLTREELSRIKSVDLSGDNTYLEPVRDVFLFCCFSGLRHSDANNLLKSDVKGDHIEITTVKTADSISIELNETTKSIIQKYSDTLLPDNKALPNMTNQAMNRDLKLLCRLAGIDEEIRVTTYKGSERQDEIHPKWELIGTHTGRRTFIVNALSLGIPPNIVMKWTGHSDYKAMKPYIDIVDSIKAESMKKFDFLL